MKYTIQFPFRGLTHRATKLICYALLGVWAHTASAQVLLSGTSFDPKVQADTSRAFWGINEIAYTGIQGGILTITPPITPNTNPNIFDATYYHAITNNPYKLDQARYQRQVGTASDNQLVISPRGTQNTPMLTYNLAGLLPGSNYEVRVSYCSISSTAVCSATGGFITSVKGAVNPANSSDGQEPTQINPGQCLNNITFTNTSSGSKPIGNDGLLSFNMNNFQNIGNCKAIGIKSIEIWGTPKPKIFASTGAEVCKGEQITLSPYQQYTGVTYQWQVKKGSGAWSNIVGGTGPTVVYEALDAPEDYQFQLQVKQGANTYTADPISVSSIVCCQVNGVDASRQTIFYDDFGRLDPADRTGRTYKVWDYTNLVDNEPVPVQVTKTTTTPFRWALATPPLNAAFKATSVIEDGEYAVAAYLTGYNTPVNGYAGAALGWAARVTGPTVVPNPDLFYDHTGDAEKDPFGAALLLNCPPNTLNQVLYTRDINNLCNQKKLFFEAWIAVFTNDAAGAYNPVNVKVRLTELDGSGNPTANVVETTATATRQASGGGVWVPIRQSITLGNTSKSFRVELINNQNVSVNGNDLVLDDIKVMACAPPSIDAYFNTALAQVISVCPANNDPVPLLTVPSALLKAYYSSAPYYLFQWTRTPNDVTSWQNIGTPSTAESNNTVNSGSHVSFASLTTSGKVYFRVIAASGGTGGTFDQKNNFQGAGNYANINAPCKSYSVSEPIEANIACLLPVHLLSFTATKKSASILLQWATVSENNNDRFVIERSSNANYFEEIGSVSGQGNSNILNNYQFVDRSPSEGISYYRLKQVDASGAVEYSRTISLRNDIETGDFTLYPNPNKGSFSIKVAQVEIGTTIEIIDINGKTVYQSVEFSESNITNVEGLKEGIYFVKLIQEQQITTQKVVVY